jgi:murein endopeptidase
VALDVHEVTNGDNDLLDLLGKLASGGEDKGLAGLDVGVKLLKDGDGESGGLASTGLGLSNDIVAWRRVCEWACKSKQRARISLPLMTGMMARCWMAEGRSKP